MLDAMKESPPRRNSLPKSGFTSPVRHLAPQSARMNMAATLTRSLMPSMFSTEDDIDDDDFCIIEEDLGVGIPVHDFYRFCLSQSINQSIDPTADQQSNQLFQRNQSINQRISQLIMQSINQSIDFWTVSLMFIFGSFVLQLKSGEPSLKFLTTEPINIVVIIWWNQMFYARFLCLFFKSFWLFVCFV